MDQNYYTGPRSANRVTIVWSFTVPPLELRGVKLQLLTIGGISVSGTWSGLVGQNFVAWAPLLKYNKEDFQAAIDSYHDHLTATKPS